MNPTAGYLLLVTEHPCADCTLSSESSLLSVVHVADKINSCSREFRAQILLQPGDLLDKALQKAPKREGWGNVLNTIC